MDGRDRCFLTCVHSCSWPPGGEGGRGCGAEPGLGRGLTQPARPLREQEKGSLQGVGASVRPRVFHFRGAGFLPGVLRVPGA